MKKTLLSLLMILVLLLSVPAALADTDFAGMTDEELTALIAGATNELSNRHLEGQKFYLPSPDGVTVYATGIVKWDDAWSGRAYVEVEVVIENQTDENKNINIAYQTVNGWDADASYFYPCAPHSKKIAGIDFRVTDNPEVRSLSDAAILTLKLSGSSNGVTFVVEDGRIVSCTNNSY